MRASWTYNQILEAYFGFFVFSMVLIPRVIGIMFIPLVIIYAIGIVKRKFTFHLDFITILFVALYLAYLVGSFFTNDELAAFKTLEYKLSLLLIPILFSLRPETKLSIKKPIFGLISGCVLAILYGLFSAIQCYLNGGGGSCFLTASISPILHPSYFMVYLALGMVGSWYGYRMNWKGFKWYLVLLFILVGIVFHGLALSLSGILFLLLAAGGIMFYYVINKWRTLGGLLALMMWPVIGYVIITTVPQVEGEWNGAKRIANEYFESTEHFVSTREYPMSGSEVRLVMWSVSISEFLSAPWGAGTGNSSSQLANRLRLVNQPELAEKGLNTHNQFLETAVEVGFIGFLLLLLIILYGLRIGIKYKNWLLLFLIFSLAFNCLFESMLQRQAGIVFYTFWIFLSLNVAELNYQKFEFKIKAKGD